MTIELKVLNPETREQQVTRFKQLLQENMKKLKTEIIEIEISELANFFRYKIKSKVENYWFPRQIRDECTKQGIKIHKKRGFTVAEITIVE
jgi:hypothetical protein